MSAESLGYSIGFLAIILLAATFLGNKLFDILSPFNRSLLSVSVVVMVLAFIDTSKLAEMFLELMAAAVLAVLIRWRLNLRDDRIVALEEKFE